MRDPELAGRPVYTARGVSDDSWLHEDRFKWFVDALGYAATQTYAIEALSAVSPEALFYAVTAIMRGAKIPEPGEKAPPQRHCPNSISPNRVLCKLPADHAGPCRTL